MLMYRMHQHHVVRDKLSLACNAAEGQRIEAETRVKQ